MMSVHKTAEHCVSNNEGGLHDSTGITAEIEPEFNTFPSVSCVVATLGRSDEVRVLLESLREQSVLPHEVVFVDQNEDDRLLPTINDFTNDLKIIRLHVPNMRGSSPARNHGLLRATGEVVIFPDDDCWYPKDFIAHGLTIMDDQSADIVSGRAADQAGNDINGNFQNFSSWVNQQNVWCTQIEWVFFAKRELLMQLEGYDEDFGVAAKYGSCEIQDLSLRAIQSGSGQFYDPTLYGHHEVFDHQNISRESLFKKAYAYGIGMGRVLRVHGYPFRSGALWVCKSLVRACIGLTKFDARNAGYYWHTAKGRFKGYFSS